MATKYAKWIIKWRWLIVLGTLLTIILAASGARFLTLNTNYRAFFSEENPQLIAFENLQKTYTSNDNILFLLAPENQQVFTQENLDAIAWLTKQAWQLPYTSRVDSVTNYQNTYAEEDDLIVEDLVMNALALSDEEVEQKRQIALTEPLLIHRLIDPKTHVTGVNVVFQLNGVGSDAVQQIMVKARELSASFTDKFPQYKVYMSGMTALNNAFPEAMATDFQSLIPMMYLLIIFTVYFLLRTISGTITTVLIIGMSVVGAMGLAGWSGLELTTPMGSVPTIIMTLAVADCIHIIAGILHQVDLGKNKQEAIVESIRINFNAVFLTSITTAIGFLSLNFSDAPPFRDLGNVSATGVMIAFVLSVTLLPALLSILPLPKKSKVFDFKMTALSSLVLHHQKALMIGVSLLAVVLIMFIPKIQLNDEFVKYFSEKIEFRRHTDFISEHLSGIYMIEFSMQAKEPGGINSPDYLNKLEEFAIWLRQQQYVEHVSPITDILKQLNQNLHQGDKAFYKIPEQQNLAAQYLLLYEMSLPFGLDLNDRIDVAKQATRLTVTLENIDSQSMRELAERSEQWLKDNAPEYMHTHAVSTGLMFAYIAERNIKSMLSGVFFALIIISALLIFALKDLRIGLISLIPNVIPVLMAFGLWSILVGTVGLASSVVAAVTMGIVVDDTIHFLSKYLRARKEHHATKEQAIEYAFSHVGTALTVTTIVLVIGFTTLGFSSFELNNSMGLLTAITIAFALLTDFLLLPALLLKFDKNNESDVKQAV